MVRSPREQTQNHLTRHGKRGLCVCSRPGSFSVLSSPRQIYANWPIDRRVEAYLRHHGLINMFNDGGTYNALLDRVMANMGRALRAGVLPASHR
jgi:hypothetical protein